MYRFLLTPAVIVVSLTLLGQTSSPPSDQSKQTPDSSCIVAGRVVTAADSAPLKSARVILTPAHSSAERDARAAISDSDGTFLFKDVEPGRYRFFASHAGFVLQGYGAKSGDTGAVLWLKPGDRIGNVVFRMTATAVIAGRGTNEDGEPMSCVKVVALRKPNEEEEDALAFDSRKKQLAPVSSAATDDRGIYRIFGLSPGDYYLQVTSSAGLGGCTETYESYRYAGSDYGGVYYPGVTQASQAQVIPLKAGEEGQADVSLQRTKTVEVAGHAIGPKGPAVNAWISLRPAEPEDYGYSREDTTEDDGSFRFKGVPPGKYVIHAYQIERVESIFGIFGRQELEVGTENTPSLTISLTHGASLPGRVTLSSTGTVTWERVRVTLSPIAEDGESNGTLQVMKDGTFEIKLLQDGRYSLAVEGLEPNFYVKSASLGAEDVLENGLQVEEGRVNGRLEITISSASAQLEGSVSDQDGAVIGAQVRAVPDPQTRYNRFRARNTVTDQTGHFLLNGLTPGKYRVLAKSAASFDERPRKAEPSVVTLSENDHKAMQLTIPPPPED